MNILLQPDAEDPRRQFYDHPAEQADRLQASLAMLARLGWQKAGPAALITDEGRRWLRITVTRAAS